MKASRKPKKPGTKKETIRHSFAELEGERIKSVDENFAGCIITTESGKEYEIFADMMRGAVLVSYTRW